MSANFLTPGLRLVIAASVFALFVFFAMWRVHGKIIDPTDPHGSEQVGRNGMADFRDVIYFPTRAVAEGINPYDSSSEPLADGSPRYWQRYPVLNLFPLYSPLVLLLFGAFALPDFYTAAAAFQVLNLALLLIWSYLIWKHADQTPTAERVLWLATAMLITQAGRAIFIGGETAIPLAIGTLLAAVHASRHPTTAGWALALTSFKPTFGLPLGLLLLFRREWKAVFLGWGLGFVIAVAGLIAIFGQTNDLARLPQIILQNQRDLESHPEATALTTSTRIDSAAALERWFQLKSSTGRLAVFLTIFVLAGTTLSRLSYHVQEPEAERLLQIVTLVGTVACMYRLTYDGIALWAAIGLLWFSPAEGWKNTSPQLRGWLGGLLLFTQINILPTEFFRKFLVQVGLTAQIPLPLAQLSWTLACILNGLALLVVLILLFIQARKWPNPREIAPAKAR